MSLCINPNCSNPQNLGTNLFCIACGSELLLDGCYRVIKELGGGGFGKTYELEDQGEIKVLKVLFNSHPKALELFKKEAEVLSQLNHPGIPTVEMDGSFEYFPRNSSTPLHCLVMEKIEGMNLEEYLKERNYQSISEKAALRWLKQLVEILQQVHAQNYFHRDIKPSNIMLRPDGQLALIDFGTAREVTQTFIQKVEGKQVTGIISPGYTPLEQMMGQAVPQSDFFALGRTFVYLLTGKAPDEFSTDSASGCLIWRENLTISQPFGDLIDSLMAPVAEKRPANAAAILESIEQIESKKSKVIQKVSQPATPVYVSPNQEGETSEVFLKNLRFYDNFLGHTAAVNAVAIHPDGKTVISGSQDKTVKVWSLETGQLLYTLAGYSVGISRLAISPDGAKLVTSDNHRTRILKVWNLLEHQFPFLIEGHNDVVHSLVFTPDGKTIISGGEQNLSLWSVETGSFLGVLEGHSQTVSSVTISSGNKKIISGSHDRTIKIWDINTRKLLRDWKLSSGRIDSVAVSPDEKILVTACCQVLIGNVSISLKVWDIENYRLIHTLDSQEHSILINSVLFNPDGKTVISDKENIIKIWNLMTGELITTLGGHSGKINSIAISPDGKTLVSGSDDKTIKVWKVKS